MTRTEKLIQEILIREELEKKRNPEVERPTIQPYAPGYLDYLNGTRKDVPKVEKSERGVLIIELG